MVIGGESNNKRVGVCFSFESDIRGAFRIGKRVISIFMNVSIVRGLSNSFETLSKVDASHRRDLTNALVETCDTPRLTNATTHRNKI